MCLAASWCRMILPQATFLSSFSVPPSNGVLVPHSPLYEVVLMPIASNRSEALPMPSTAHSIVYNVLYRCCPNFSKVHHKNGKAAPTTNHVGRRPVLQRAQKKKYITENIKSLPYTMKAHISLKNTSFCTNMAHFKPRKAFSVHVLSLKQQLFHHLRTSALS